MAGVKRAGARIPLIPILVALLLLIVAVAAGLEGRFSFAGALFTPGKAARPVDTSTPPSDVSTAAATAKPTIGTGITFGLLPILIVLGCLILAVVGLLLLYWVRNRGLGRRFARIDDSLNEELQRSADEQEADLPTLHRGLVLAADVLESNREPRDAIVRAWLGLQEAAEDSGVARRASETPTEFTTRVFESVDGDRAAAADLLEVYLRVRFRSTPATIEDVVVARDAIDRLRSTWPAVSPE